MRKGGGRVSLSPDAEEKPTVSLTLLKTNSKRAGGDANKVPRGFGCRLLRTARCSAVKFFRRVRANMARALKMVSARGPFYGPSSSTSLHKFVPPVDAHQSEAIEECIKFINSSSRKYD
uniref:Josephin-like protein n=1 Tax=Ananas comosus var. bracteatus TaxID=296719 RepID=A0A6V7QVV9_ANACO